MKFYTPLKSKFEAITNLLFEKVTSSETIMLQPEKHGNVEIEKLTTRVKFYIYTSLKYILEYTKKLLLFCDLVTSAETVSLQLKNFEIVENNELTTTFV